MDLKRPSGQTVSDILGKDMATIARELNEPGVMNEIKLNGVELNVNEIIVKNRKRQTDEEKVTEIMESIKEIGLLNPVSVNKTPEGYILVAGLHRLTAYKRLGYNRIQAIVVDMDDAHSELAEIDENLVRAELHYLDRAEMLKRRREIYEELHPAFAKSEKVKKNLKQFRPTENETVSFSDGDSKDKALTGIKSGDNFVSDTAKKTGLSERAVQQDLQLAKNLDEGAKKQIKNKKISKGDALKVAREKKENQQKAIKDLTEKPKMEPQKTPVISTDALPPDFDKDRVREQLAGPLSKKAFDEVFKSGPESQEQEIDKSSLDKMIEEFNSAPKIRNIRIAKDKSSIIIWAEEQTLKNIIGSLGVVFAGPEEKKC